MRRKQTQLADSFVYVTRAEAIKLGLNLPSEHCDGDVYERSTVELARYRTNRNQVSDTNESDAPWPSYWLIAFCLALYGAFVALLAWLNTRK